MACIVIGLGDINKLESSSFLRFGYTISYNPMGFRCGYIRITKGHPWHMIKYGDIHPHPAVHGGLTFSDCDSDDDSWWVGFDCGHYNDIPDPDLMSEACKGHSHIGGTAGTIKTQDFVREECKRLIAQAIAAKINNLTE